MSDTKPTSLADILDIFAREVWACKDVPFAGDILDIPRREAINQITALMPERDTRKHAIEGPDEFIQIGFNMAIDQIHKNFNGEA